MRLQNQIFFFQRLENTRLEQTGRGSWVGTEWVKTPESLSVPSCPPTVLGPQRQKVAALDESRDEAGGENLALNRSKSRSPFNLRHGGLYTAEGSDQGQTKGV